MKGFVSFVALSFFISTSLQAQNNIQAWSRLSVNHAIGKRLSADWEFHQRWQDTHEHPNRAIHSLLQSFRPTLNYKFNPRWTLSVVPYSLYKHYRYNESNHQISTSLETRFAILAQQTIPFATKWQFTSRIGIEARLFDGDNDIRTRGRKRFGVRVRLSPQTSIQAFDELHFQYTFNSKKLQFDQNRLGISYTYNLNSHLSLETGYIFNRRSIANPKNMVSDHALQLNIAVRL